MGGFVGSFEHAIDAKGRLSIPAKFKEFLNTHSGGKVMITTLVMDPCLVAYPIPEWEAFDARAQKMSSTDDGMRDFLRIFYSNATECPLDRQGRVLISGTLRGKVQLDGDVILIGMGNKFEIWSLSLWRERQPSMLQSFQASKGILASLGV